MSEMTCASCDQPISAGQLYHQVHRVTDPYSENAADWPTSSDLFIAVHVDCEEAAGAPVGGGNLCRRCGELTQWGLCATCQPRQFAGLGHGPGGAQ